MRRLWPILVALVLLSLPAVADYIGLIPNNTVVGNASGGRAAAVPLSAATATSVLNAFVGDGGSGGTKGLVPAPGAGDAAAGKFLAADGTFSVPPGTGTGTVTSITCGTGLSGGTITTTGTCALSTPVSVANGGIGLTSGTSGGILGYTASGTLASSAALTAHGLVIGGGAGATPTALAPGSQYQMLRQGATDPAWEDAPYDLATFMPGTPAASAIARVAVVRPVKLSAGLSGLACIGKTAATGSTTVTLNKVSAGVTTAIGSLAWSGSGTTCSPTFSSDVTLAAGDMLEEAWPVSPDATLADIAITLPGVRQ